MRMNPLIEFHLRFGLSERIVIRFELERRVVECGWVNSDGAANA